MSHALHFFAVELIDQPLGHANHRMGRVAARREGVGRRIVDHAEERSGDMRRERHLVDDVRNHLGFRRPGREVMRPDCAEQH